MRAARGTRPGRSSWPPASRPSAQGDANAGKAVYEHKCLLCHGEKGDGKGPAAEHLLPRPRDFTRGPLQDPDDGEQDADRPGPVQDHHRRDARDLHAAVGGSS